MRMHKMLNWKFSQYLRDHKITPYRLEQTLHGKVSRRLPYDWSKQAPERLYLDVLAKVLAGLEQLTGQPVSVDDIMEFQTISSGSKADDTKEWLEADLAPKLPAYDWGKRGPPKAKSVRYIEGQGFVVEQAL